MKQETTSDLPQIYDYADYRLFLKARYERLKKTKFTFSYRYLAKKVGSTDNYFKYIFDCKKNISLDRVTKTAQAFKLTYEETQYLTFQVVRQNLNEPTLSKEFDAILYALKHKMMLLEKGSLSRKAADLDLAEKGILSMMLIELVKLHSFKSDPIWIKKKLGPYFEFSIEKIGATLKDLTTAGFLEKIGDSVRSKNEDFLTTIGTFKSTLFSKELVSFLSDFYNNSTRYQFKSARNSFLTIDSRDFEKLHNLRFEYCNKLRELAEAGENKDLVVLNSTALVGVSQPD